MYKLVALDMDGTILRNDHTISQRTINALTKARNNGTHVVLCTGRPLSAIGTYLNDLNLFDGKNYVICLNGALIQDTQENVISSSFLKHEDFYDLCNLNKSLKSHLHAICAHGSFTTSSSPNHYAFNHAEKCNITVQTIEENSLPEDAVVMKIMFIDEADTIKRLSNSLPQWVRDKYNVMQSSPYYLEIVHKDASKGNAVENLSNYLGMKKEEVICIGDEENDLSMITHAGLGIAMGNAIDALKEAAQYITSTNEEDGVALAVEKFILSPCAQ